MIRMKNVGRDSWLGIKTIQLDFGTITADAQKGQILTGVEAVEIIEYGVQYSAITAGTAPTVGPVLKRFNGIIDVSNVSKGTVVHTAATCAMTSLGCTIKKFYPNEALISDPSSLNNAGFGGDANGTKYLGLGLRITITGSPTNVTAVIGWIKYRPVAIADL